MLKRISARRDAIALILERLAADVEVVRKGLEALKLALPRDFELHRQLLTTQSAALERISIGLGMVQNTAESLGEIHGHAEAIMQEVEVLALVKNGLDMVLSQRTHGEDWIPLMLERTTCRFQLSLARIREKAVLLGWEDPAATSDSAKKSGS